MVILIKELKRSRNWDGKLYQLPRITIPIKNFIMSKKNTYLKNYINNYWLKRTLKYYALMLVVFYFLLNSDYFQNHYSFFIFPLDFLGASYGEFYELSVFKFLIYNFLISFGCYWQSL
jgi:hypothetical protein